MFIIFILCPAKVKVENTNEELFKKSDSGSFSYRAHAIVVILHKEIWSRYKDKQKETLKTHCTFSVSAIFTNSRSLIDFSRPVYSLLSILYHARYDSSFKKIN